MSSNLLSVCLQVQHGGVELFERKREELGQDPLRADADAEALWERVRRSLETDRRRECNRVHLGGLAMWTGCNPVWPFLPPYMLQLQPCLSNLQPCVSRLQPCVASLRPLAPRVPP